uniref:(R,S)-reticuline 7-O-methyltransferase-like n=1 Tax=Erigeron canadensis TaxID=72917 RepID=UPI001CB9772B|nr:(R,S)-reticuline 7-O-methyltransferase-like [Erigeron canadensis]
MNTQNGIDDHAMLKGQSQILRYIYGALDGMAIRCCVELRIADIINNRGRPATLSEIATDIDSSTINVDGLGRLMRFLVGKKVFDQSNQHHEEREMVYSLNHCSKWLLCDTDMTLAPLVMMRTDPVFVSPLHVMSQSIKEGGSTFKKTHGKELFDFCTFNSEFNRVFNEGMACTAKIATEAIMSSYKNGFLELKGRMVDVGGGTGVAISEIVKAYPHLTGINFDLPHVISTAPTYEGVTHVTGDMFKAIPPAETIFMKWILHDWGDNDCIKILKNCRKVLASETGKLIIVEIVQMPAGDDIFDDTRLTYDLVMFSHFSSGRERSESEWTKLLVEGGFLRHNVIKTQALQSIIEAFPQ